MCVCGGGSAGWEPTSGADLAEHVWSLGEPLSLLRRLRRWGLNCYMYAPKDELKHRLLWREPYTEHEAGSGSAGPQHGWAAGVLGARG